MSKIASKPCWSGNRNTAFSAVVILAVGLMITDCLRAQTFTTLYSFTGGDDGGYPLAGLVFYSDKLYGTTSAFGGSNSGTIFVVNTDGSQFTNTHAFSGENDGFDPMADLVLSGTTLYGSASAGGSVGNGSLFKINTDGTGFAPFYIFGVNYNAGANPEARLAIANGTAYAATLNGGFYNQGKLFEVKLDGSGYRSLFDFGNTGDGAYYPQGGLLLSQNTLYGSTEQGGVSGSGTVYSFGINGTGVGFSNLHNFGPLAGSVPPTNSDGADPQGALLVSGGTLYGTTSTGGSNGYGTVFKLNVDGTGFKVLHSFTNEPDGANPQAGLVLLGNALYGTTFSGGNSGNGTIFAVSTDGSGFTNLYEFSGGGDGANPRAGLVSSKNTLYGTTSAGGSSFLGTIFSLSLNPPRLTAFLAGTNVVVAWDNTVSGYALQSTASLIPPANWTAVSSIPVVVNGQNEVTNQLPGTQRFFRLRK
jgi:uncharacterized repeat protein (TIGR03803 family)